MTLVPLDLPTPESMRDPWAACAAMIGALGHGDEDCHARGGDWYHHDGGGNWAALARFVDGRAVLFGHDHEYGETYFREAAAYFGESETDLLAGAPAWWGEALAGFTTHEWIGFVYGFDAGCWSRAAYAVEDGFTALDLPVLTPQRALASTIGHHPGSEAAARVLLTAGPGATPEQVAALGARSVTPEVGARTAAAFGEPGRR